MLKIFMSYAQEDRANVRPFYKKFSEAGFLPWMDIEDILPGQNWEAEIDRAFNEAHVILLFLSKCSVSKRGFVQREMNQAIDNLKYKQPADIYAIPILLSDCEVPPAIALRLQHIDSRASDMWERLVRSLSAASAQHKIVLEQGSVHGPYRVLEKSIEEFWIGQPGHDIKISYPLFLSDLVPMAASTISALQEGRARLALIGARAKPWGQMPDIFPAEEIGSSRSMDGRWDGYTIAFANESIVSLSYNVGWYGAGAMHPNSHFECFNYAVAEDRVYGVELADLFNDYSSAIRIIGETCTTELKREYWERTGEEPCADQTRWIEEGVKDVGANLHQFTLDREGITFMFAPYQVAAYAFGTFFVTVPFFNLLPYLNQEGIFKFVRK